MSEASKDPKEPKDTREAAAEGAAKAPAAAKAKFNFKVPPLFVLIGVVALGLLAGSALGGLLVAPRLNAMRHTAALKAALDPLHTAEKKAKRDKDKKSKKSDTGKPTAYKLENIIVNPAGSQGQRFLMCSVAIASDDSKALDVLREHELELRDRVVTLLSQQTLERLTADNARDSLRAELLTRIRPVLGPDGADTELKIYLPQFVVQ